MDSFLSCMCIVCIAFYAIYKYNYNNNYNYKNKYKIKNKININNRYKRHGDFRGITPLNSQNFVKNFNNSVEMLWRWVWKRAFQR